MIAFVIFIAIDQMSAQIWVQDFETNGLGINYTSPSVFSVNMNGHYNRTNGGNISNVTAPYTNMHGTFFWAGENLNITPGGDGLSDKTITFAPITVTGQTNLQFRGLFATGNQMGGWDFSDQLYVEYKMDGGPWTKCLQFASNGQVQNTGLYVDTNLDGVGEGAVLTTAFHQFTANIPATGVSIQIRVYSKNTSQGEEFAFDYLRLYSTTTAVNGCTNPLASNYNVAATVDNGSCIISGCTSADALNYNPEATTDNSTCVFSVPNIVINEIHFNPNDMVGNTDVDFEFIELKNNTSSAVNVAGWRISEAVDATFPTGTTIPANGYLVVASNTTSYAGNGYPVVAFTDDLSNNGETIRLSTNNFILVDVVTYYNAGGWPIAADGNGPSLELINPTLNNNVFDSYCSSSNDGTPGASNSCYTSSILGCTNPLASNYNDYANTDDGSCLIAGCICATALNYNADATVDDGSCQFTIDISGCTYLIASNYNPQSTIDDGSCIFLQPLTGCICATALNYNPDAQVDDGSCVYEEILPGCTYEIATNYNPSATLDDGTCAFVITDPCAGDLNNDHIVGVTDLIIFIAAYGNSCP